MFRTLLPLLIGILVIESGATEDQQCGENETFTTCGSACPPTCQKPVPTVCTYQCVRGCFCNEGLLRSGSGNCIKPTDC